MLGTESDNISESSAMIGESQSLSPFSPTSLPAKGPLPNLPTFNLSEEIGNATFLLVVVLKRQCINLGNVYRYRVIVVAGSS